MFSHMALTSPPQSNPGMRPLFVDLFTPELGEVIRARLEGGETVNRLCAQPGMPISSTFYRWRAVHGDWGASIVLAQQAGARLRARLRTEAAAAKAKPHARYRWKRVTPDYALRRAAVLEVARGLAEGKSLGTICTGPDMPTQHMMLSWLHEHPDLALIYGEARAAQRGAYEAQIHDLFANLTRANRAESEQRFRQLRTQMSRRAPKGWGLEQRPPMPKTWEDARLAWERAEPAPPVDSPLAIRQARKRLGLSQAQFAARFGLSPDTLRNYEQGHRRPTGPTRVLLAVIASEPAAVMRVVGQLSNNRMHNNPCQSDC